jgi:hypothetical protein
MQIVAAAFDHIDAFLGEVRQYSRQKSKNRLQKIMDLIARLKRVEPVFLTL